MENKNTIAAMTVGMLKRALAEVDDDTPIGHTTLATEDTVRPITGIAMHKGTLILDSHNESEDLEPVKDAQDIETGKLAIPG